MDNNMTRHSPDYCVDFTNSTGFMDSRAVTYDGTSTDSSGSSPVMMFSSLGSLTYDPFSASNVFQNVDHDPASPLVEFTDLTVPYHEDRRRRRSHVIRDKQTISTMHMRRRAQNRASQRAFRERKEKHAHDLQRQLDDLATKHRSLLTSYEELGDTNTKLAGELEQLRERINSLQTSRSKTLDDMMSSTLFEPFNFDQTSDTVLTADD